MGKAMFRALVMALIFLPVTVAAYPDDTVAQLRDMLREHLKNPEFSLDHKPEYVVTDLATIEPALDYALRYIKAGSPVTEQQIADARSRAVTAYKTGLATPLGLRALEALIAKRFAHPIVSRRPVTGGRGEEVTFDHGRMPGELSADFFGPYPLARGPDFENWLPTSAFLARTLADAVRAHPTAARVTVRFTLPRFRRNGEFQLNYLRDGFPDSRRGWMTLTTRSVTGVTPPYEVRVYNEDFSPYIDGTFSVYEKCTPLLYIPNSQARAESLKALKGKCINYGRPD